MTNTQQTVEPTAMLQDAFSLQRIQMLILWPLMVCLALAPLLFYNSEDYGYSKAFFQLSFLIIFILNMYVSMNINSINLTNNLKQMPEIINKKDEKKLKKYIKIIQIDHFFTWEWTSFFGAALIYNKWYTGAVTNADIQWDIGNTSLVNNLIAALQLHFPLLILFGLLMYYFELKPRPYYWWAKKKSNNNIVTLMLILELVVASGRFDLVIDGKVPIETYLPTQWSSQDIEDLSSLLYVFLPLVFLSFFVKVLSFSQISYYILLSRVIAKGKNKKRIYIVTFALSILSCLIAYFSPVFYDHLLLPIGFGILSVVLGVKWYYSVANNAGKLLENCQSDLQIKCEEMFKKHKLFLNRKAALICISITRYVDNNFLLFSFSSLLYGAMLSALLFL